MSHETPDFESIKQINPYGMEYWSARALAPLLAYTKWQNFTTVLQRAMIACEQSGQILTDHFTGASKVITAGKGASHTVRDYFLSRYACYLVALNGDPRKPAIAAAQTYFVIAAREKELADLYLEQAKRLQLRLRVAENNQKLAEAAAQAGVRSQSFGQFQQAGYKAMYHGLGVADLKERKGIPPSAELLDHMGRAELSANDFRITQTEEKLRQEQVQGEAAAIATHRAVGERVRQAIRDIGGRLPEDLPAEPSIKPLLDAQRRQRKRIKPPGDAPNAEDPVQGSLL